MRTQTIDVMKEMEKEILKALEISKALKVLRVDDEVVFMTLAAMFVKSYGNSVSTSNFIMFPEFADGTTMPPTYYIQCNKDLDKGPRYLLDYICAITNMETVSEATSEMGNSVLRLVKPRGN